MQKVKQAIEDLESLSGKKIFQDTNLQNSPIGVTYYNERIFELRLDGCTLKTLPESIANLQTLTFLDLPNNKLEVLPDSICELKSLETLYLNHNQLNQLPNDIGKLKSLRCLNIDDNRLMILPNSFGKLSNLEVLDLSNNNLGELPATFGELKNLQSIHLANNQLNRLPESFGELRQLQTLELANNNLTELPISMAELRSLEVLDLSNNNLRELPATFGELKNLQSIDLANNQLNRLPESFGELRQLQTLELANNNLTELPISMEKLSSLEILKINNNPIKVFPDFLSSLMSLRVFNLAQVAIDNTLHEYNLKMCLLGAKGVGKKSFRNAIFTRSTTEDYLKTIGTTFFMTNLDFDGKIIDLTFWLCNTKAEIFKEPGLLSQFIRNSSGILIIFDLTNPETLKHIEEIFEEIFHSWFELNSVPIFLIGNKADLIKERRISYQEVREKVHEFRKKYPILTGGIIPYFEISAIKLKNIEIITKIITGLFIAESWYSTDIQKKLKLLQEDLDYLEDLINYLPESDEKYLARAEYADFVDYILAFLMKNVKHSSDFLKELISEIEFSKCRGITDYILNYQIKIEDKQIHNLISQEQALLRDIHRTSEEIENMEIRNGKLVKNPLVLRRRREWDFQLLKDLRKQIISKTPMMSHIYPDRNNRKEILEHFLSVAELETDWAVLEFIHAGNALGVIFLNSSRKIEFHRPEIDATSLNEMVDSLGEHLRKGFNLLFKIIYDIPDLHSKKALELMNKVKSHIENYSKELYKLIPPPIQQNLKSKKYEHLIIIPHKELHSLIWELVHDGEDFWGLKYSIARNFSLDLTRLVFDKRQGFDNSKDKFQALFIGNPNDGQFKVIKDKINDETKVMRIPLDLRGSEKEIELISNNFNKYNNTEKPIILLREEASKNNFKAALETNLNLIHFAGHGEWTGQDPDRSYLLFHCKKDEVEEYCDEEIFRATELASTTHFKKPLILVLSACESGKSEVIRGDEFFGFIRGAILTGATSIIVSNWVVFDKSTQDFMEFFYSKICEGNSIGLALRDARRNIFRKANDDNYGYEENQALKLLHWASFTIFGDPFQKFEDIGT